MNSKEMTTIVNKINNQKIQAQHRKQSGLKMTYVIASLISLWLAEQFFGHPYNFREIEI